MLEAFLDWQRSEIVAKCTGVTEAKARARLVPSATTLAGIVRHLHVVEANWFCRTLDRRWPVGLPPFEDLVAADRGFELADEDDLDALIADYQAQCALSRAIAARHDLADVVPHDELGEVSLRWIYVHMIEETARHAGHADILHEQLDAAESER
jgi:uncharacterized damage-inducible protein DinB